MLIEKPKVYQTCAARRAQCHVPLCIYSSQVYCAGCYSPACGHHLYRDELDGLINLCVNCVLDSAVVLAAKGVPPLKERVTLDQVRDMARAPQHLAPRNLTFEQAQRYERELGTDPTVLGKLGIRCSALFPLGPGQVVFCNLERGHVGNHRAGGNAVWEGQDSY